MTKSVIFLTVNIRFEQLYIKNQNYARIEVPICVFVSKQFPAVVTQL